MPRDRSTRSSSEGGRLRPVRDFCCFAKAQRRRLSLSFADLPLGHGDGSDHGHPPSGTKEVTTAKAPQRLETRTHRSQDEAELAQELHLQSSAHKLVHIRIGSHLAHDLGEGGGGCALSLLLSPVLSAPSSSSVCSRVYFSPNLLFRRLFSQPSRSQRVMRVEGRGPRLLELLRLHAQPLVRLKAGAGILGTTPSGGLLSQL